MPAAIGTNVGNLVVKLNGDASGYQKMLKSAQSSLSSFGKTMSTYVTAPLTLLGGLAVREFAKFDKAMVESLSIMQTTAEQESRMRKQALDLASAGAKAPEEIARSYFYLASAGLSAEQQMKVLPVVMKFATAGAFDMARATELLMDAQSALGLKVADANQNMMNAKRVSDVLVRANVLANGSVEQFAAALTSKAGSAMKVFNVSVEEGTAVLAAMADQGIKAELAGNNFARILFLMSKASMDNQEAFRKWNFSMYDARGNLRPLADIVQNLEKVLAPLSAMEKSAALEALGFEARVQGAIMPLIGTSDAIRRYYNELKNATGYSEEVAQKQMKSFAWQMANLWNQVKVVGIGIGEQLSPKLKALGDILKGLMNTWNGFSQSTQSTITNLLILTAAIGPIAFGFSKAAQATLYLATQFSMLGSAATASAGGLYAIVAALSVGTGLLINNYVFGVKKAREEMAALDEQASRARLSFQKLHAVMVQDAEKMQGGKKKSFLQARIAEERQALNTYLDEVNRANEHLQEVMSSWTARNITRDEAQADYDRAVANYRARIEALQQLKTMLEEVDKVEEERTKAEEGLEVARINEIKTSVEDLTKEFEKMNATVGMSEMESKIWELQQKGATEEQLARLRELAAANKELEKQEDKRKDMEEKAKSMTEEFQSPVEKYLKTQEDTMKLAETGAISWKTYDRAMKQAYTDYLNGMREQARANQMFRNDLFLNNQAVREGTDEFYRMMQLVPGRAQAQPQEQIPPGAPNAGNPEDLKIQKEQRDLLQKIYESNKAKSEILTVPADL